MKIRKWISDVFYSFPVQLFTLHLRNNLLLLGIWILLMLLMTGTLGQFFGIKFLFLAPEYMGVINFWSFFFTGLAFGGFVITWNLTSYLLDAHHFPFLASLSKPFTKFCLNNILVPLIFLLTYLYFTIHFQWFEELRPALIIFRNCFGFLLGAALIISFSGAYFYFTNKDILSFLKRGKKLPPNIAGEHGPGWRFTPIEEIKSGKVKWRVDTYLTLKFKPKLVRSVAHYDSSILLSVFRQNHGNALIVQLVSLFFLITLGYLVDRPAFRIPAGASLFILASILVSITGAITYWFQEWRITVLIVLLIAINFITRYDYFNHKNKAYGLDYSKDYVTYDYATLNKSCYKDVVEEDKKNTLKILERWHQKAQVKNKEKPRMIFICASGGGLKASVWAMQVAQQVDSVLNGKLMKNTVLMTGASGGLNGLAYFRELYLRKQMGEELDIYNRKYVDNISKDLLNSIAVTIVANDLFLPWAKFKLGGHTYRKDRGYVFEKQFHENTNYVFDKTLKDYRQPEITATIPMLFVTPSVVNDGRRMIISPQNVSYMTKAPVRLADQSQIEIDAVDFRHVFKEHGADDLNFITALRMNATYPYILPNVYLPSKPEVEVMDAGFRDNYGINSATRFIHVFKDWIKENTSGVTLVVISGWNKIDEIKSSGKQGVLESLFNPLGIAGKILKLQDYEHDTNLGYIFDLLGEDMFDVIRFIYRPTDNNKEASMTFHLTQKEENDILNAIYLQTNQTSLDRLVKTLTVPSKLKTAKN
ncbi:MAG TPA: patatin-like phospholipase family protein [Saprospiraceae bacterium]|nr:patatin-like phospholipase family protein [Saprospiraceae bacterium]